MRNVFASLMTMAGLLAVAVPLAAQAPALKIGYIDTRRIIAEAPGTQEAQQTMQKEMQGWEAQMKLMEDSLRTIVTDYQQKSLVMSPEAKQRREQEIRDKQAGFEQRADSLRQLAQKRQQELMQPIMEKVDAIIAEVRKAEGFGIVFDASSEVIVSADPALDLTEKVLARLKATAAATTSK